MVKNESLPPKATYGSNFQMPKNCVFSWIHDSMSHLHLWVWHRSGRLPSNLAQFNPCVFFCTSNRHQFSWNRVPLAKTSSWKHDDIFFRITMFPEEPLWTSLNLAPVRWGHQDLCEMGSGSSSSAFFRSHLWMSEINRWEQVRHLLWS